MTLSDTLADVRAKALLYALADTGAELEAEALYVVKPYETLLCTLAYILP